MLEGSDYFQQTPKRRRSSTHKKRIEDGSNEISSSHDSKKIPQVMTNMKDSILEEPIIHLSIWPKKSDAVMNEEYDEAEGSRRSLPKNKDKYSIVIS